MSDVEPGVPLEELDPGHGDPGYWTRFHRSVMQAAAPGLARRVVRAPTFEDLLASWSRLFVPAAVAVAAIAGLLLVSDVDRDPVATLVGVEELLTPNWSEVDGDPLPASFFVEDDFEAILVAANPF